MPVRQNLCQQPTRHFSRLEGWKCRTCGFGTKLGHTAVEYPWPYQKSWFCSQKNHQFEELRIWSHTNKYFARAVVPNFWLMSKQNQKTSQVPVCSANKVTSIHPLAQKNPKTTQISRFVLKIGRNTITNNNTIADYCRWLQENSSQQQRYSPSKKKTLGPLRHHSGIIGTLVWASAVLARAVWKVVTTPPGSMSEHSGYLRRSNPTTMWGFGGSVMGYDSDTLWLCQNSYWKWPFIVDFPIKHGDSP